LDVGCVPKRLELKAHAVEETVGAVAFELEDGGRLAVCELDREEHHVVGPKEPRSVERRGDPDRNLVESVDVVDRVGRRAGQDAGLAIGGSNGRYV
jgi:hypothetical protein